jgi:uncharacterized membrane protein YkvA (DUF1232 family)
MIRKILGLAAVAAVVGATLCSPAMGQVLTQRKEPDHIRGTVASVEASSVTVRTKDGRSVRMAVSDATTVFKLTRARFTDLDFGTYVGAIGRRLDQFSPILRDSMSYLYQGFELRIIDDDLRGIAIGHTPWDLVPDSTMTHGWVDDIEIRVLSIKYGPTEEEETDVDTASGPVTRMSLADRTLVKPGAAIFAGAEKGAGGGYEAAFIFVGDGVEPPL